MLIISIIVSAFIGVVVGQGVELSDFNCATKSKYVTDCDQVK